MAILKRAEGTLLNYPVTVIQGYTFSTPKNIQPDMKYAFIIPKVAYSKKATESREYQYVCYKYIVFC